MLFDVMCNQSEHVFNSHNLYLARSPVFNAMFEHSMMEESRKVRACVCVYVRVCLCICCACVCGQGVCSTVCLHVLKTISSWTRFHILIMKSW